MVLRRLGYWDKQTKAIEDFIMGTKSLDGFPNPSYETLESLGFTSAQIKNIENKLPDVFDIRSAFSPSILGRDAYKFIRND